MNTEAYLNTSYVMVHLVWKNLLSSFYIFKYILCYGSSSAAKSSFCVHADLNTSYVMVHHRLQEYRN